MKVFIKEKVQKMAIENLNEDPERGDAVIKAIKDWMKKQPHLKDNVEMVSKVGTYFLRTSLKTKLEKILVPSK